MTTDQIVLFSLFVVIFTLLIWGRFRYDVVAFGALVIAYLCGVVPTSEVFSGFAHPATVIIALVLVISRGLSSSGAIDMLTRRMVNSSRGVQAHIGLFAALSAGLSAVMNNVAALALLMPVDMQAAKRAKRGPALTLMPLSFASILGGMVTLIGTPPNVVIATFRKETLGEPFGMFDFAPVGLAVAVVGVAFVALVGWRLIPGARVKRDAREELMDLEGYVAEARVPEGGSAVGKRLHELQPLADESDVNLLGVVRRERRLPGLGRFEVLEAGDLIILEAGPESIEQFVGAAGLVYVGTEAMQGLLGETSALLEVVVPQGSRIVGRSALDVQLLHRQGVTLLGISRRGQRFRDQVRRISIQAGDILLLLGLEERMNDVVAWLGCLPLADRGLKVAQRGKAWLAAGCFAGAIVLASLGWVYLPVALAAVVVIYVVFQVVPLSQVYESVEWSVIVLLGSLIPLGAALEATGGAALIASAIVNWTEGWPPAAVLAVLMIVTMTLSDVLNNVATALIAAPIGVDIATRLGVNPDPFLMAVAVGASCAFLTPIGHKNNTIIMGPGGYKFGDYWRMGLPLEILVVVVGLSAILLVWPL